MRALDVARKVKTLFAPRSRRASVGTRRAHVEFRVGADDEIEVFAAGLRRLAKDLPGLEWLEVNAHTKRVVFGYREAACDADQLVELVEQAERLAQLSAAAFDEAVEYSADDELGVRRIVELCADVTGFMVALGLSFSPVPALPFTGNAVAALSVIRSVPRLRKGLEERWGRERAEFLLNLTSSATQAAAQRPLSLLVDSVHKLELLRETKAQRDVWRLREDELHRVRASESAPHVIGQGQLQDRPCELPRGPIEEYAEHAWAVSLSGFALSFLTTRSFQRATAALFGGLPRPARMGRDVFASELSCALAARGIFCRDAGVLRRLDRLNCLVLPNDLVLRDNFLVSGVLTEDPDDATAVRERAAHLFDPVHPLNDQVDGLWRLCPLGSTRSTIDVHLQEAAKPRLAQGSLLLSLERAGRVVGIIEVEIVARTGVEELIAAAHEAQMRVVIAMGDESVLDRLNADDVIPKHEGLRAGIRRLQREGNGVVFVGTGTSEGLALSDCGVGLTREGEPTPWGAHIVCGKDLADVRYIIEASRRARQLSKQAVKVALGAASFGALVSAGGLLPLTMRRVLFVVNAASLISMANGYRASLELQRLSLPQPRDPTPWHALDNLGVLRRLGSSLDGLSRTEVIRRVELSIAGPSDWNRLTEAISDELFSPFAPLLAAGAGLSAVVGSLADAGMVAGVFVLNAVVGGGQRYRTERKIRELMRPEQRRARVRRDGVEYSVEQSDLVRGDVIVLSPGDILLADCRIVEANSLEVDASTLTGEALPVLKTSRASFESHIADRASMLYEGSTIAAGRGIAVVVAAGAATEARRGAAVTGRGRMKGGVEQRLRSLMDLTGPVALAAGIGVIGGGLLRGRKLDELVGSGVSLAVASVPEGLPLLATAAQLAAAQRLSKRSALVRNGRSIEALGRVDVICLDKTGTVTEGRVELSSINDCEVDEPLQRLSRSRRDVLAAALRASFEPGIIPEQDPIDDALYRSAEATAIAADFNKLGYRRVNELSFEAGRSYHATLGRVGEQLILDIKGAPEAILPMCNYWRHGSETDPLTDDLRYAFAMRATAMARNGFRLLAVAERDSGLQSGPLRPESLEQMSFLGFLVFTDPVRPTARDAVRGLRLAGVKTMMLTGDHPSTAEAIARELELLTDGDVMTGAKLADMDDDALDLCIGKISVFARVTPAQKVRVVRALQRAGRVVAMAGDGANDAPAIRLADVGVAIGEHSTAAARGAADIVLTDGRIETLVRAIAEGRAMWSSVRDAVSILVGGNLGEIAFTTAVGLVSGRPPLNARQLLLVNLLTDIAPAMVIALRPPSEAMIEELAHEGPEASLGQPLTRDIALRAALTSFGAGTAFVTARAFGSREKARTVALAALVGTQLGQTLTSGQGSRAVTATSLASAGLLALVIQTPGLSHFFGCRPLGPVGWATAIGASAAATNAPRLVEVLVRSLRERGSKMLTEPPQADHALRELGKSGAT
jgi:cation-transporting P-type ATPase I